MLAESYAAAAPSWWRRFALSLRRGARAVSEAVRVPDHKGIVIPVAIISVLVGVLVTLAGVFFRAGQVVQNQANQDRDWADLRVEIKDKLAAVDRLEGEVRGLRSDREADARGWGEFVRSSLKKQSELGASFASLGDELKRQERERRLLQDYVEGRVGAMPYRPPAEKPIPH